MNEITVKYVLSRLRGGKMQETQEIINMLNKEMPETYEVVSSYPTGEVECQGTYETIEEAEEVYKDLLDTSDEGYAVMLTKNAISVVEYVPVILQHEIKKAGR